MTTWTEMTALQLATAVLRGTIPRDQMVLTRSGGVETAPAIPLPTVSYPAPVAPVAEEKSPDPQPGPRQSDDTSAAPTPKRKPGRPPRPENSYLPSGKLTRADPTIKRKRRVGKTPELRRLKALWISYRKGALQKRMPEHEAFQDYQSFCARCREWMEAGEPDTWAGWTKNGVEEVLSPELSSAISS